jgi:hypothetical protein
MTSLTTEELVAWYFEHRVELEQCFKGASKDGTRASIDMLYDAWSMLGMKHRFGLTVYPRYWLVG